ncbi:uncharacterized protein N7483_004437 [Penicillium malachiteum]|uniref:uncharacterized protein n=1 Tax=Penicillium malachiteum TaxID=1324776 RepID=UPI002547E822|nr:uncharacterized protein N7483_004437 [Penicillium malachiteum]KAJ5729929.1 hypothetical protein N7483_004437 [Penicillium malachiteum]
MANPPRTLQTRLTHLLRHWPADPVRPASVSVQAYLQAALGQKPEVEPKKSKSEDAPPARQPVISNASASALQALLENRFASSYPMAKNIRYPASDPDHYDNVVREFEEAPNRDWVGRIRKRLGGLFRLT